MHSINSDNFVNRFTSHFKGDLSESELPRQTPGVLFAKTSPTPVRAPQLVAWSNELAKELGVSKPEHEKEIAILAGNKIAPSMNPYAARYGGHQFGHWAGQLGDGRAITLGEWKAADGKTYEFQLKGAGPTAYSRRADGRAVLRSSVREYLMSEAMHYLGIPTTRALSLVTTGDLVMRDMFYDGNAGYEPGAIVLRVAPTFLRFGNFEILAAKNENENLSQLVDWTISNFFQNISGEDKILLWFNEVVETTAVLMVEWLRVGFVHGVMNTDNMSILGLTIDYGPYSFLDDYDPSFTPNTTDLPGRRYAFGRQPSIGYWNLGCLANALVPLVKDIKSLEGVLHRYEELIANAYHKMMASKMGFDEIHKEDSVLLEKWEQVLSAIKPDMTIFYQLLAGLPDYKIAKEETVRHFQESFYEDLQLQNADELFSVIELFQKRKKENKISTEASAEIMKKANPKFVLRNYLLHQAIEALQNDDRTLFDQLKEAMKTPYDSTNDAFFTRRPSWATTKAGCSMLSCSS
jgi:uncharacterized protein YdiU (UPF0061 family)